MQFKGIEIIRIECSGKDAANLREVFRKFQFFSRAANRQIVHKNLPLLDGALRHAPDFSELKVSKVLHADPDASAKHRQNQA